LINEHYRYIASINKSLALKYRMIRLIIAFTFFVLSLTINYPYTCTKADRLVTSCPTENVGVCGNYDPTLFQCAKNAPCGQSYINVCAACHNPVVKSVTQGDCQLIR
jgi:hypothetical protein